MEEENQKVDNSNFENLVSSLSDSERQDMLTKMNSTKDEQFSEKEKKYNNEKSENFNLTIKFDQESLFKKIILWLKSFFTNTSLEEVYNLDLVKHIARDLEFDCPDVLDYKKKILKSFFYEKLLELKNIQNFLKPFVEVASQDEGKFLYELATIVMPDYQDYIKKECDPFQFPEEDSLSLETRTSLLKKLDSYLSNIPSENKSSMYSCARLFEWLKNFVRLPLQDFISKFQDSENGKFCNISELSGDFAIFVKVMSFECVFNEEFFYALFYNFQNNASNFSNASSLNLNDFLNKIDSQISLLQSFDQAIEIEKLAKVVFQNAFYVPESLGGFEAWLKKFKSYWKTVFDKRWAQRNFEHKKQIILKKMRLFFSVKNFQQLPFRPWVKLQVVRNFKYDLSAGFLYYFFSTEYPKHKNLLKTLTLEADFSVKENRQELTDVLSDISTLKEDTEILVKQFSDSGEYGQTFNEYASENPIKKNHLNSIDLILDEAAKNFETIESKFVKDVYTLQMIMNAGSGDIESSSYGVISNYNKIMGISNSRFQVDYENCRDAFKYAREILSELQVLENSSSDF